MRLKKSIDNLYTVFSIYHVEGNLRERSCDCCVTNEEIKLLLSKPFRELRKGDINHFMTSAITTYGDVNDYKHFLPRILELTLDYDVLSDFVIFEKLEYANWKSWQENEVSAVEVFFESLFIFYLKNNSNSFELSDVINLSIKYLGEKRTFNIWKENLSESHLSFFVDYKLGISDLLLLDFKKTLFEKWICSDFILNKLEALFLKTKDKIEANRISIAYTILLNERDLK